MPPSSCVAMSRKIDAASVVEGGRGLMICGEPCKPPEKRVAKARLCSLTAGPAQLAKSCSKNIHSLGGSWQTTVAPFNLACSWGPTWEFAASGACSLGQGLPAALFTCYLTFNSYRRRALPLTYLDGLSAPFNPFVALFRWVIAEI